MKQGIDMLYYSFSVFIFCVALMLLAALSHSIYKFEHQISKMTYKQHVITCELESA